MLSLADTAVPAKPLRSATCISDLHTGRPTTAYGLFE